MDQQLPGREPVVVKDKERLNRRFERLEKVLPGPVSRSIRWLREPSSRWLRIPVGIFLILGGIFSILPALGLWMLPLGLLLLAQDVRFLRGPTARTMVWLERRLVEWKRRLRRRFLKEG